jgi:fumarate hydratase subunit beta
MPRVMPGVSCEAIMIKRVTFPLTSAAVRDLQAGDMVSLNGPILTARDAAHKRLIQTLDAGEPLPVDLNGQTIYYLGPTPAAPGQVIGAAGPTTASRMDTYTPRLLALGLRGMLGKGKRSPEVIEAMKQYEAVYFAATGGAAALLARSVTSCEIIAYPDLGTEAIRRLELRDFPAIVAIDCHGNNRYEQGPALYRREKS